MKDLTRNISDKDMTDFSKAVAYWLRHSPESIGIQLNTEGYVSTSIFIDAINKEGHWHINLQTLKKVVNEDNKKRYSFKDNFSLIRANQGHSTSQVNIQFKKYNANSVLYHGTTLENLEKINKSGSILPMLRQYVHLSKDSSTARRVGDRQHSKTVVLMIDAIKMQSEGYELFESENGVVLTKEVPIKYII